MRGVINKYEEEKYLPRIMQSAYKLLVEFGHVTVSPCYKVVQCMASGVVMAGSNSLMNMEDIPDREVLFLKLARWQ